MADPPRKNFKLLPEQEFWKLSRDDRLQYLKAAADLAPKRAPRPVKRGSKKHA
jgi:hypothetical protein